MLLASEQTQLKEWGNGTAIRISKKLLQSLDFDKGVTYDLQAIEEEGVKKLVISPTSTISENLELLESMAGILSSDRDVNSYRRQRHQERLDKYESLT